MLAFLPLLGLMNPAPDLVRPKSDFRQLDCERMSVQTGHRLYPGDVQAEPPRGEYRKRDVVVCRERLLHPDVRRPAEDAILRDLAYTSQALAETAASLRPDLADRTWLVESFHASVPVATKVSFATKNALMQQGLRVSDRTPVLGAGDVDVLTRMSPEQAYPAACLRWSQTGSLTHHDALLAVVHRDPRETVLHLGLCADGVWTWLR